MAVCTAKPPSPIGRTPANANLKLAIAIVIASMRPSTRRWQVGVLPPGQLSCTVGPERMIMLMTGLIVLPCGFLAPPAIFICKLAVAVNVTVSLITLTVPPRPLPLKMPF